MLVLIASGGGSRRFFLSVKVFGESQTGRNCTVGCPNIFQVFFHVNTHKKWTYEKPAHYGPFISVFEMEGWPGHVCDIGMEFLVLFFRA